MREEAAKITNETKYSPEMVERIDSVYEFKQRGAESMMVLMHEEIKQIRKKYKMKQEDAEKFAKLFSKYLQARMQKLEWEKISAPPESMIVDYAVAEAPHTENVTELLNKLAILKLNGGLGTSMGCTGPKSAIEVKYRMNFIDLSVRQIEHLNSTHGTSVPIILMNSFNTK